MTFSVSILGCGAAIPLTHRNPSAQVVNVKEQLYLFDCAEGTQVQLRKNHFRLQKIENIFISHLHGDHYFGLMGLIT
ncbi:MAG: ribonuclease Z, partial [Bacteroidetes bacterium]